MGRLRLLLVARILVKKSTALLAIAAVVTVLAGCGSSGSDRVRQMMEVPDSEYATPGVSESPTSEAAPATTTEPTPALPGASDASTASIESDPSTVVGGGEIRLSVAGFAKGGEVVVSALKKGTSQSIEIARQTVGQDGALSGATVRIPNSLGAGTYTLRASQEASGATAEATLYVTASTPELTLDSAAVRQGGTVTVSAAGFDPGENLYLYVAGVSAKPLLETSADRGGNVDPTSVRLPPLPAGDLTLRLQNKSGSRAATRIVSVVERSPWVVLDPYALTPNQSLGYTGFDFIPGENVKVVLDSQTTSPLAIVTVNDGGSFNQANAYTPTAKAVGKHTLTFVGEHSKKAVDVGFEVISHAPSFGLSPYAGPPGTVVRFEGKGFEPGETIRVLLGDDQHEEASFTAGKDGAFTGLGQVTIPLSAKPGKLKITLVGEQSQAPVSQELNVLELTPWAGLSVYAGDRGTAIYVEGRGFAPGEDVDVYLGDDTEPLATAQADSSGRVSRLGPIKLPDAESGQQATFVLKGQVSGARATVDFAITGTSSDRNQDTPTPATP